jgi:phage FluMu protein Com
MGAHFVQCANCGGQFRVAEGVMSWNCPACQTINQPPAGALATKIWGPAVAEQRRKPIGVQLSDAWARATGKKPLWGYDNQFLVVTCPNCQQQANVSVNVQVNQCGSCGVQYQVPGP